MGRGIWTKKDTEAFNGIYGATKQFLSDYNDTRAGEIYKQAEGLGKVDPAEYDKYAAQFKTTAPEAAQAYADAAQKVRSGDPAYQGVSDSDRRQAGLRAQANYYSGVGNIKRANELYDQVDQMDLRGLQKTDAQLGIDAKKQAAADAERNRKLLEQFQKDVSDPFAYLQRQFDQDLIGGQDMAGKKVQYQRTNGGAMAWLTDADGNPILDKNGSPMARHMTLEQGRDMALKHYLTQTNPVEQAKIDKEDRRWGIMADKYDEDRASREREGKADRESRERIARLAHGGGGTSQNWQAFGSDADGTPVLLNSKNFDPTKAGVGLVRVDGKPVQNINHVYKSRTGDKGLGEGKPQLTFKEFMESPFAPERKKGEDAEVYAGRVKDAHAKFITGESRPLVLTPPDASKQPPVAAPVQEAPPAKFGERTFGPGGGTRDIPVPDGMDNPDAWKAFLRGGIFGYGGLSGR